MAHQVKCKICSQMFDRDKLAYVKPSGNRYAHASCYLRARQLDPSLPELEITDPNDFVECAVCGKIINKKKDEYTQLANKKYVHLECAKIEETREKTDIEKLDIYIMKLFGWNYVPPRVRKQINSYLKEYDFTYSGIKKSLQYFYEIKGNSIDKANGGIGIVPYIYKDAYNYYYMLWEAKQRNQNVVVQDYVPVVKEIIIPVPERKVRSRKLFQFLDEEEE